MMLFFSAKKRLKAKRKERYSCIKRELQQEPEIDDDPEIKLLKRLLEEKRQRKRNKDFDM